MNNTTYNINLINQNIAKLQSDISIKELLKIINYLYEQGEIGEENLLNLLIKRQITEKRPVTILDGLLFQQLYKTQNKQILKKLQSYFHKGIMIFDNNLKINYQPLQQLLINQNFKEADKLTQEYLCQLAGLNINSHRKWLYFTDIESIPIEDLLQIDLLWQIYSQGKFGFSIQRKIWITKKYKWNDFFKSIGWIINDIPCRYPIDFKWTLKAPIGHLPLFNQLRGIQVLSALFKHTAWQ